MGVVITDRKLFNRLVNAIIMKALIHSLKEITDIYDVNKNEDVIGS